MMPLDLGFQNIPSVVRSLKVDFISETRVGQLKFGFDLMRMAVLEQKRIKSFANPVTQRASDLG